MSKIEDAVARLLRDVEREDPYGCAVVNRDDLRAILDAYAALRDEREALRARLTEAERRCSELEARLEAAERVITASEARLKVWTRETFVGLEDELTRYRARFGGRADV